MAVAATGTVSSAKRRLRRRGVFATFLLGNSCTTGEAHATLVIDADTLDDHLVAQLADVFDVVHAEVSQFGNVDEAFLARKTFDEYAEFFHGAHDAFISFLDFDLSRNQVHFIDSAGELLCIDCKDGDPTGVVLVDINLATGILGDAFDILTTWTNKRADLVGRNLDTVGYVECVP